MIDGNCTVLFRKNKLGVGEWRIWNDGPTIYVGHAQVVDGSLVVHKEIVPKGLAGRSLEEQVQSRIDSRINKQLDKGYVYSIEEARNNPRTNMLDLPHPMLAKKISDLRGWPGKSVVQRKYDGFRCLSARNEDLDAICYTRGGKILDALTHIIDRLKYVLPEDVILDGEIYEHGKPLQTIASLAKRKQPGTEKLVYHVYDCITEGNFLERYEIARDIVQRINSEHIVMVENHPINSQDDMWELFVQHRAEKYEGSMLRLLKGHYDSGSRSSSLYKVKAREDDEFTVLDVTEDANGCGVLRLKLENARKPYFDTSAPGSHDQKRFVLHHKDQYIGRKVTVEFANYTADGVPFHAVATRWREEL